MSRGPRFVSLAAVVLLAAVADAARGGPAPDLPSRCRQPCGTGERGAEPLEEMRRAAQRIASGCYEERVPVASQDELGELADQFNRMAASLQRLERLRRDLVADVAHELRTPLSGLAGYLKGLLDGVLVPSPESWAECNGRCAG